MNFEERVQRQSEANRRQQLRHLEEDRRKRELLARMNEQLSEVLSEVHAACLNSPHHRAAAIYSTPPGEGMFALLRESSGAYPGPQTGWRLGPYFLGDDLRLYTHDTYHTRPLDPSIRYGKNVERFLKSKGANFVVHDPTPVEVTSERLSSNTGDFGPLYGVIGLLDSKLRINYGYDLADTLSAEFLKELEKRS